MTNQEMLRLVSRDFGAPVIAWVCNLSKEEAQSLAAGDLPLDGIRSQILDRLVQALFSLRVQAAIEGAPVHLLLSQLSLAQGSADRNILNVWREEASGTLPNIVTDDKVAEPLQHLALDAYPNLLMAPYLLRRWDAGGMMMHSTFSFRHPARKRFEAAILEDEALTLLFPTKGQNGISTFGYVTASTGTGGSLQLVGLAAQMIQCAYALMRMRGQLSVEELCNSTHEVIDLIRKACVGKAVKLPTFVGFNNVALEVSSPIQLPWGTLRPYTQAFSEFIPSEAGPSHFIDNGTDVTLGVVLETDFPYEIRVEPWAPGPPIDDIPIWPSNTERWRAEFEHNCRLTSLALSLAIERDPPVATALAWVMRLDPLFSSNSVSWRSAAYPPFDPFVLKEDSAASISRWASAIAAVDDAGIRIAQQRIVGALAQRHDPADSFIDAVVAWENLYGSGEGELTFRISVSMASLLSEDSDERLAVQREIAALYGRRSKVLHGDTDPSPRDATRDRDRALSLVLATLRRLYQDFPELISQKDRGKLIVLRL